MYEPKNEEFISIQKFDQRSNTGENLYYLVEPLRHKMVLAEALPEDENLGHQDWKYAAIQLELPCLVVHLVMMPLMETEK